MINRDFIVIFLIIILAVKLVIIIQLIRIMVLRCDYHFLILLSFSNRLFIFI